MSNTDKRPVAEPAGSENWWDATATENVIGACLQQIESLRGKLPMGVALSLQRAHTALKESLVNARELKPKSPNTKPSDGRDERRTRTNPTPRPLRRRVRE